MKERGEEMKLLLPLLAVIFFAHSGSADETHGTNETHGTVAPDCCEMGSTPMMMSCDARVNRFPYNQCRQEYQRCCEEPDKLCGEMALEVTSHSCEERDNMKPAICAENDLFDLFCECCERAQNQRPDGMTCLQFSQGIMARGDNECELQALLACCDDTVAPNVVQGINPDGIALYDAVADECRSPSTSYTPIQQSLAMTACECCKMAKLMSPQDCDTRKAHLLTSNGCQQAFGDCCKDADVSDTCFAVAIIGDPHRPCTAREDLAELMVSKKCGQVYVDACDCCSAGKAFSQNSTHTCRAEYDKMLDPFCKNAFQLCCEDDTAQITQEGDPHFVTFDGAKLTYQGPCRYVLIQTDPRFLGYLQPFTITAKNAIHKPDLASYLDDVEVAIGDWRIRLNVRGEIFVNGHLRVDPIQEGPFLVKRSILENILPNGPKRTLREPVLHLETSLLVNVTTTVQRSDGQGRFYLNIEVPKSYRGKVAGLGGNFNGDPEDDYRMADGRDVKNIWPELFRSQMIADSWLVKDDPDNLKTGYPCRID